MEGTMDGCDRFDDQGKPKAWRNMAHAHGTNKQRSSVGEINNS